ncbi:hypothetical protein ACOSQ2_009252 [Xanthoceras sorbifolium]
MELLSHSHLRISHVNAKCKIFSQYQRKRKIPIKPTCRFSDFSFKCSYAFSSLRLYNPTIGFKHGTERLYKRSSISAADPAGSDPILNKPSNFLDACWSFMRPFSLYGNVVVSASLVTRSWLLENPSLITSSLLLKASYGLLALIFVNGYVSGINQIYDVNIDKINKPYLPIAAGQLSVKFAWSLVIFYAVTGVLIVGLNGGLFLACLYSLVLFLGTAYSVPPFRLKRFAFGTMLTFASVRGFLLHFIVSYASSAGLGLIFQWTAPLVFITIKASFFALVMSFVKDLSDVDGDRKYTVSTLAVKFGVRNIAFLGSGILLVKYIVGVLAATYMPQAFNRNVMIPAQIILASCLIFQAWVLEKTNYTKEASGKFYGFIWNLMNAEYLIYPFI